jgi:hypothetical protein
MAAVTAFFLVGSTHPFDGGLDPTFVVKLYEGDKAFWQATNVEDSDKVIEMDPEGSSSEEIYRTGCRLVNLLAHNFGTDAAGLIVFRGSSIEVPVSNIQNDISIQLYFLTIV